MIQAQIIADSKNEFGNRLTTMVVTFPRIILAEFNTHRMFSWRETGWCGNFKGFIQYRKMFENENITK